MKQVVKENNSYLYAEKLALLRLQLIILIAVSIYFILKLSDIYILIPLTFGIILSSYLIASFLPTVILTQGCLKYKTSFLPFFYKKLQLDSLKQILIKGIKETKQYAQADSDGQWIYTKNIEVYALDSNNKKKLLFIEDIGGDSSISKKVIKDRKSTLKKFFEGTRIRIEL